MNAAVNAKNGNGARRAFKLMIVDDSNIMKRRIERAQNFDELELVGTASNGIEAIEMFKKMDPDVVTMDLTMPQMDGVDAFREIRALDERIPVLLMSGYNEQDAVMRFAGKGLAGFLQKPFSVEMLRERLMSVLR